VICATLNAVDWPGRIWIFSRPTFTAPLICGKNAPFETPYSARNSLMVATATRTSRLFCTAVSMSAWSTGSLISSAQLSSEPAASSRDSKLARQSGRRTVAAPEGVSARAAGGDSMRFFPVASESKNVRAESSAFEGARHAGGASISGRL